MTTPDTERLHRVLGTADLDWLIKRVRTRLSRGQPITGSVTLDSASESQRRAIESLLGRVPGRGASLSVSLDEIDTLIRRSTLHPDGLAAAVQALRGPVIPAATAAAAQQASWDRALAPLQRLAEQRPELRAWYTDPRTHGLIQRLTGNTALAEPVLERLAHVLSALPANGAGMPRFAASVTHDAHGLDQGTILATLAESAIRATWAPAVAAEGGPAQRRRALWDAVGVLLDALSSTVLCLNIDFAPHTFLHRLTQAASGEPVVLTLRQLTREPVVITSPAPVFACENPAVLAAAADEFGATTPPMVCIAGQPSTAAWHLLTAMNSRAEVRYHGDFDWGGLSIANFLLTRIDWQPWRYDSAAYLATGTTIGRPLRGTPRPATWDPYLMLAMLERGHGIDEEAVLDDLLNDLRHHITA